MSLASIAIRRPVTTLMLYTGIVLLGLVALFNLPVDFLPTIQIPKITVQTFYPGTSPAEVEFVVTQPIESSLGTVAGVKKIRSITREGLSVVTVEFYWGTSMDFAVLELREKLDQVRWAFPIEVGRPAILRVDPSVEPIMTIAVSSWRFSSGDETRELAEVNEIARTLLKRRIEQVDGVAQAAVIGGVEREVHVDVHLPVLRALGIGIDQVSEALAAANVNLPGGSIRQGLFRYALRTAGECKDLDDIRNVVICRTGAGRQIRIADCATVRDAHRERSGLTRYNGREVIVIQVRKEADANTVRVSRLVHSVLDQLQNENPGLSLMVIADHAEFIAQSVSDVQHAIAIGALLASVVLFYFLKQPRYPLIIGLTIPVSILATIVVMHFLRINLNVISLTGLALGIGMLGDNAIVLIENVSRLREHGMPLVDATLEGAREIGTAVTASTLTNVAIFLPIMFVEGVAAQLFADMGATMTISLMVSLLVAVTLVPMLVSREGFRGSRAVRRLGRMVPVSRESAIWRRVAPSLNIERLDESLRQGVGWYLTWALDHRAAVLWTAVVLLVCAIIIALHIPAEPAPDIDQRRFIVQVRLPRGTSLEGTSNFSRSIEAPLGAMQGVRGVFARVGATEGDVFAHVHEASSEVAFLEVILQEQAAAPVIMDAARTFLQHLSASTDGIEYSVKPRGTSFEQILRPEPNDVCCNIVGHDMAAVERLAGLYAQKIQRIPGLVDLRLSLQEGTPEHHITIDREAAGRHGLSVREVATHLMRTVRGNEASSLSDFDRKVTIRVKPSAGSRGDVSAVLESYVGAGENAVPVRSVTTWKETRGYAEIWRENQQRTHVLVANVSGRSVGKVVRDLEDAAKELHLPPGYSIFIGGENEEIRESFLGLSVVILLSLFLVSRSSPRSMSPSCIRSSYC